MKFLSGQCLSTEIDAILKQDGLRLAVAFWGSGANARIASAEGRIICNLQSGGTNPHVIKELISRKINVRQCNDLHAKVYIGRTQTIICSANVSTNGLGMENKEAAGWREAGVITETTIAIEEWFDALWDEHSSEIDSTSLKIAIVNWKARQIKKAQPVKSFSFVPDTMPLLTCYGDTEGISNYLILSKNLGYNDKRKIDRIVGDSLEINGPSEKKAFYRGRWVLWYYVSPSSGLAQKSGMEWTCLDREIKKAWKENSKAPWLDIFIPDEFPLKPPFSISTPEFKSHFISLMNSAKYIPLRDMEYKNEWFNAARLRLTFEFWTELQSILEG